MSGAGAIVSAAGQLIGGLADMEAGKFNRKVAKTNAVNSERDGAMREAQIRDRARLVMGNQIAAQAGSGFEIGTGSALDALKESAIEAELDIMLTRRGAAAEAQGYRTQGKIAYAQGYNSMIGGFFGAAKSVSDYQSQRRQNATQGGSDSGS